MLRNLSRCQPSSYDVPVFNNYIYARRDTIMNRLQTVRQVAESMRVKEDVVRFLVQAGEMSAYRIGDDYRFEPSDVIDYLNRMRIRAIDDEPAQDKSDA